MYLEGSIGVTVVHLKMLDGHGVARVFSVAHVCGPAVIADSSDAYQLPLENTGGGHDPSGSTDLGEESQAAPPQFILGAQPRKRLYILLLAIDIQRTEPTYLVKKIDKPLGFVSLEAPSDSDVGWTSQEGPDRREGFIRRDFR